MKFSLRGFVRNGMALMLLLLPFASSAQSGDNPALEGPALSGLPVSPISDIIANTMYWLLAILGFIAIIGFIISGLLYLTAAGSDSQIKTAKTAMTWSIVGVIVALMGYVIIQAVDVWLGGSVYF